MRNGKNWKNEKGIQQDCILNEGLVIILGILIRENERDIRH